MATAMAQGRLLTAFMKINTQEYRPDIDGLRAIAVSLVVIYHAYSEWMTGGFVGVDVFFVISGFLITNIIAGELRQGEFSFRRFYEKRIRRIFPALILVLLACLILGYFTLLAREYKPLGKHVLGGATYISNVILMKEAGYFDDSSDFKALLHLWSLAIEEQFYLVWPVVLALAFAAKKRLPWVVGIATLLSFGLCIFFTQRAPEHVFFNPVTRSWELFIGAFIALIPSVSTVSVTPASGESAAAQLARLAAQYKNLLSITGLLLIAGAAVFFDEANLFPYWRALLPCVGAALIIWAGKDATVNKYVLSLRPMIYIGLISYPLYLWHWPALFFARMISNDQLDVWTIGGAVLISLLAAAATYHLVEKKLRRSSFKPLPWILLVVLLVLGALGGLIYKKDGLPGRFPAAEERARNVGSFEWYAQGNDFSTACVQQLGNKFPEYCNMMDLSRPATIALIGDSTANHFYLGFANQLASKSKAENLVEIGKGGCPALLDVDAARNTGMNDCDDTMADALKYVEATPTIHTVVLSMTGATYMNETLAAIKARAPYYRLRSISDPKLEDPAPIVEKGLRKTLDYLVKSGKNVVFLLSIPALNFEPEDCSNIRPFSIKGPKHSSCEVDRATIDSINNGYRTVVFNVLKDFPQVKLWDPYNLICGPDGCRTLEGAIPLYRDKIHLSVYGSDYIAQRLPMDELLGAKTPP